MSALTRKCKLLVTGAAGQLGQALAKELTTFCEIEAILLDSAQLDITNAKAVRAAIEGYQPTIVVNAAAFTAVDAAESSFEKAFEVNEVAVRILAKQCKASDVGLIHISTDYVFDGMATIPYVETDAVNPQSVYGKSKRAGEEALLDTDLERFAIIRTAWLYSEFGSNFMKTMLRLAKENDEVSVVTDQLGAPTSAHDLAKAILQIALRLNTSNSGMYHFSNSGEASWYDFASYIFEQANISVRLNAVNSKAFVTAAERPKYSVLNSGKIQGAFGIAIPHWRDSASSILSIVID